jgi:hypothetical protein
MMTWGKGATALTIPLALGACVATSVRGLRERPPVLVSDSGRTTTAVSQCIVDKWVSLGFTPRTLPREHGTSLLAELVVNYALPIMVVDIDTNSAGSHVTMRQFKTLWSKQNRQRVDEVRACL